MKKSCTKCGRLAFSNNLNEKEICKDCLQKSKWELPKNSWGYFLEHVGLGFFGIMILFMFAIVIAFQFSLLFALYIVGGLIGVLGLFFIIGLIIKK